MNENVAMPRMHGVVRDVLCTDHKGAVRAICQADLAAKVGLRRRMVRQIIKDLIEQFGQPIGTLYTKHGGYFWATSKTEMDISCMKISDHCISGLSRVAALKGITLREFVGQLDLGI